MRNSLKAEKTYCTQHDHAPHFDVEQQTNEAAGVSKDELKEAKMRLCSIIFCFKAQQSTERKSWEMVVPSAVW